MATPLLDGSIIEVTWWQKFQNQVLLNVHHYLFQLPGNAPAFRPELADLLANFTAVGAINAKMAALCSTGWTLEYVGAQCVHAPRLKTVYIQPSLAGTTGGSEAPSNVAAVLTKESDFATRWGTGSWHQGGLTSSQVAGGVLTLGTVVGLTAIGAQLVLAQTTPSGATYEPIIWTAQNPLRITPLRDTFSQPTTRVMRRRTHHVGI